MTAGPPRAAQPGQTWRRHYRPGEFAPMHPLPPNVSNVLPLTFVRAKPGLTWKRHFHPAAVRPMHPLPYVPAPEAPVSPYDVALILPMMAAM